MNKKVKFCKDCMNVCKYIKKDKEYEITREEKSTVWVIDETCEEQPYPRAWVIEECVDNGR